jgi:hypothetical protein
MLDQFLAGLREVGALAEALYQRHLETPLELLHLMRHCGLREVQLFCRRGEAAALDHFDESPELIQVETAHALTTIKVSY